MNFPNNDSLSLEWVAQITCSEIFSHWPSILQNFHFVSSNFNLLKKNNSINSTYNGIAFTVDKLNENPNKVRLFALRSFGESLYHSITDAALEFGYENK